MNNKWLITNEMLIEAEKELMNSKEPIFQRMLDGTVRISELAEAIEIK